MSVPRTNRELEARIALREHERKSQQLLGTPFVDRALHHHQSALTIHATTLRLMGKTKAAENVNHAIEFLEAAREDLE